LQTLRPISDHIVQSSFKLTNNGRTSAGPIVQQQQNNRKQLNLKMLPAHEEQEQLDA